MSQLNTRCSANIPLKADHTFNLNHFTAWNNKAMGKLWKRLLKNTLVKETKPMTLIE